MQSRGLKTLILATTLVPSLLIALLLGIYLSSSRQHDLETLLRERAQACATQLANAARHDLMATDAAALQEMALLALEERGVESVDIFDAQMRRLAHAGPQREAAAPQLAAQRTLSEFATTLRLTQPVARQNSFTSTLGAAATNSSAPIGWVVVEYSRQAYLLENYQTVFVGGLIILLALVGASAIAVFAAQRWERAVGILSLGIRRIERGEFTTPIDLLHDSELQTLAQEINRMADTVQTDAIELRRNLEQTNRDLRESLETVEVQNIELDLARREALEASRIKSEFLANTSHELRTPLTGIIGFTKLLLKGLLDTRQREYMETIRYSAENLLTIINDILDFSKIEAGKLVLDNVPFNLRDLIEETLTMLAPSATEKKLDLILLYDNDVPPDLVGDPLRLRQILTNLISNGIKFTASGHIAVRVSLAGPNAARVPLKIAVSDTGIGLSEAQQKHLFHAFAQADASTSREFGGTGLGLAISKRLVEQMGGEVGLSSQAGHGATFWFSVRLPLQYHPLRTREFEQLAGKQLLLYDPRPLSQLALRQLLESWQVRVVPIDDWQALQKNDTPACDGWLLSMGYDHAPLATLQKIATPVWALLAGALVQVNRMPGVQLLPQPIGHVQLYDALCHVLYRRVAAIASARPLIERINPLRVLAVDDNATNLKLLAIMLEELGASAATAASGRQALGLCDRQHFDLILLDLQMPEMSGAQVAQLLRQGNSSNRTTRIVALTAHLLPEEREVLLTQGFNACFTKPISEQQLLQLLTSASEPLTEAAVQPVQIQLCLQRARNKPALAKEFLTELLLSLAATRAAICSYRHIEQHSALLDEVHRLHGACCYSGVARLQQTSHQLEQLLKTHSAAELIDPAIDALLMAIDELIAWHDQHDIEIVFEDSDSSEATSSR